MGGVFDGPVCADGGGKACGGQPCGGQACGGQACGGEVVAGGGGGFAVHLAGCGDAGEGAKTGHGGCALGSPIREKSVNVVAYRGVAGRDPAMVASVVMWLCSAPGGVAKSSSRSSANSAKSTQVSPPQTDAASAMTRMSKSPCRREFPRRGSATPAKIVNNDPIGPSIRTKDRIQIRQKANAHSSNAIPLRLRPPSGSVSVPLCGRGTIVQVAPSRCRIAPKSARDC